MSYIINRNENVKYFFLIILSFFIAFIFCFDLTEKLGYFFVNSFKLINKELTMKEERVVHLNSTPPYRMWNGITSIEQKRIKDIIPEFLRRLKEQHNIEATIDEEYNIMYDPSTITKEQIMVINNSVWKDYYLNGQHF